MHAIKRLYIFILMFGLVLLTACGGGGGTSTSSSSHSSSSSSISSFNSSSSILARTLSFVRSGSLRGQVGDVMVNPATSLGTGNLTYTSSNTDVATVDDDGYVSLLSPGVVVISALKAADALYGETTNSYSINVGSNVVMTAWIGANDTLVDLPDSAQGSEFYRTSEHSCDPINFIQCANGQFNILTTNPITDTAATLNQTAYYLLKKEDKQFRLSVDLDKYTKRTGQQIVVYKNELWLIGGLIGADRFSDKSSNDVWSSPDGIIWTLKTANADFAPRYNHQVTVFNNQLWLIGGIYNGESGAPNHDIWSSSDGIHWVQQTANPAFAARTGHQVTVFNNKLWLVGGNDGISFGEVYRDVWSSEDGVHWVQEVANAAFLDQFNVDQIFAFKNKLWLIGRAFGFSTVAAWSSVDGKTWREEIPNNAAHTEHGNLQVVIYKDKIWLVTGNDIWSSADGTNWEEETDNGFPFHFALTAVSFLNKLWVIGSIGSSYALVNDVWTSTDGMNWAEQTTNANFKQYQAYQAASLNDQLWLMSSSTDQKMHILSSSDGMSWSERGFNGAPSPRIGGEVVAHNNQLWIIGGSVEITAARTVAINDMWSSEDGNSWVEKTGNTPARAGHSCISFNGKLWLIGGYGVDGLRRNDVWSTVDGASWKLETENAAFSPRDGHKLAVFNNKLWVIGDTNHRKDIWSSSDGVNWQNVSFSEEYLGSFSVSVYNNKLWIISKGESWFSSDGTSWSKVLNDLPSEWVGSHESSEMGQLVVHEGRLMMLGGRASNQVWSSTDGIHWRLGYRAKFL